MVAVATAAMALVGMAIARYLVLPLRAAPALNTPLITLMAAPCCAKVCGCSTRKAPILPLPPAAEERDRPRRFQPAADNVIMLTRRCCRAVAQDEETARTMGIDFTAIVLITFAIGSALAAFAGVINGLYYNEINFGMGLYLGAIGFSAAIIGGLGSIYGAILGGFLFAALQSAGAVLLPVASAYKDVFAFAVVIVIMAWRPTGLIQEKISERV